MRILRASDDALLVEVDDGEAAVALHADLTADPVDGVGETVPGARTVLVPFAPWQVDADTLTTELGRRVSRLAPGGAPAGSRTGAAPESSPVEIQVVYDGEDLAEVAAHLGWSVEELVRRHQAATWRVAFLGFAPGFGYLTSDDPELEVPRRTTPRTRVPAGAVALAGPYGGVYPRESPGGWQLLGRTDAVVWDVSRPRPALWGPGDVVRFVAVEADQIGSSSSDRQFELPTGRRTADLIPRRRPGPPGIEVVAAGTQALVQDLGRTGVARWGVSGSGAADPRSHRAAQRAVGNPPDAAGIEALGGGMRLRAHGRQIVAVAGSDARATVHPADGGAPARVPPSSAVALHHGDELTLDPPTRGLRTTVAVRGGIDVPPVLGARATDVLARLGPAPLTPGTLLPVGAAPGAAVAGHDVGAPDPHDLPAPGTTTVLPIMLGPRHDWFDPASLTALTDQEWEVTDRADRVGLRLHGATPLTRAAATRHRELPSEACVTGALQVPPDGQPVLFGPDHPLTGGYPVVGVVDATHRWLIGQLPPGARVRFSARSPV